MYVMLIKITSSNFGFRKSDERTKIRKPLVITTQYYNHSDTFGLGKQNTVDQAAKKLIYQLKKPQKLEKDE